MQVDAFGQRADVSFSSCGKWYEGTVITALTKKAKDWLGATSITIESGVGIEIWEEKLQDAGLAIALPTK
jgi:hypothetical protein